MTDQIREAAEAVYEVFTRETGYSVREKDEKLDELRDALDAKKTSKKDAE